jgi:hypothetical protein
MSCLCIVIGMASDLPLPHGPRMKPALAHENLLSERSWVLHSPANHTAVPRTGPENIEAMCQGTGRQIWAWANITLMAIKLRGLKRCETKPGYVGRRAILQGTKSKRVKEKAARWRCSGRWGGTPKQPQLILAKPQLLNTRIQPHDSCISNRPPISTSFGQSGLNISQQSTPNHAHHSNHALKVNPTKGGAPGRPAAAEDSLDSTEHPLVPRNPAPTKTYPRRGAQARRRPADGAPSRPRAAQYVFSPPTAHHTTSPTNSPPCRVQTPTMPSTGPAPTPSSRPPSDSQPSPTSTTKRRRAPSSARPSTRCAPRTARAPTSATRSTLPSRSRGSRAR